jgi:hypothetical protein
MANARVFKTDRVVLVPGPGPEVAGVNRIYRLFVEDGQNERSIAGILNYEGALTDMGRPWTRGTVHQVGRCLGWRSEHPRPSRSGQSSYES